MDSSRHFPLVQKVGRAFRLESLGVALSLSLACSSSAPPGATVGGSAHGGTAAGGSAHGGTAAGGSAHGGTAAGGSAHGGAAAAGSAHGGAAAAGSAHGGAAAAGSAHGGAAAGDSGLGGAAGDYWKPELGLTWQWQLSEALASPLDVAVYDIDWESDAATVDALHARGIKVICYVSVGSWEDFRPDADSFPVSVIGNDYDGWPGEKYVDIRSAELRAIMSRRFDVCQAKGFDAIEPDNQDVYDLGEASGFPLTRADGVAYARWLADEAHARGMSIGQKNAPNLTKDIAALYDWALTESCYSDGDWCGEVRAYVDAGKPVFMCEYSESSFEAACRAWKTEGYSPILKNLDLDSAITFCP